MGALMIALAAVFVFTGVMGLGLAFVGDVGGERAGKRISAVAAGGRTERIAGKAAPDAAAQRRKQIVENLKIIDRQERKAKHTIASRIAQAGLTLSVRNFWIGSVGLGLAAGLLGGALTHMPLVALGAAFGVGFGLPRWLLSFICKGRHKKFTADFPNAVDIITRGIKAGLPLHDCLKVIAAESPEPVATEFKKLVENLGMGLSTDQALEKMHSRMSTSEVRFFSIVLAIQQKSGGNLAEALGNLSTVLRSRALMGEKIKALSGEAVASAGIIGCLPPGLICMITVTQPTYMTPLWTDPRGHMMLMISGGMMGFGIFIMRRMINFKF